MTSKFFKLIRITTRNLRNIGLGNIFLRLLLIPCFALTFLSCAQKSKEESFNELIDKAHKFASENKLEEARISFRSALQIKPDAAKYYFELGDILAKQKKIAEAIANYQEALNLAPAHREARLRLASLQLLAGRPELAESNIRKLLANNETDEEALLLFANLKAKRKDIDGASKLLDKILKLNPKNTGALMSLAEIARAKKDLDKAEQILLAALKDSPSNKMLQMSLIDLYASEGKGEQAKSLLQNLVSKNKTNAGLRMYYAKFLLSFGAPKLATIEFKETLKLEPLRIAARDRLYELYVVQGKRDKAKQLTKELEEFAPQNPTLNYFRARDLELEGRFDDALKEYIASMPKIRNFAPLFRRAGIIEMALGNSKEGLEHLNQAVHIDQFDIGARVTLARYFYKQKDYTLALQHVSNALKKYPRHIGANIIRGDIARENGDFGTAEHVYQSLVTAFPDKAVGYVKLGTLAEKRKDYALAEKYYKKAVSYDINVGFPAKRLATILYKTKSLDEAISTFETLFSQSHKSKAELGFLLSSLLLAKDKSLPSEEEPRVRKLLNTAISEKPGFMPAYSLLAKLDLAHGNTDQAINRYRSLIGKEPKNIVIRHLLALTLQKQGNFNEAIDSYEQILKLSPNFAPAANNLAWLLIEHSNSKGDQTLNLDRALDLALKAKQELPQDSAVADTLAWVYYKRKSYRSAHLQLEDSIKLAEKDGKGLVNPEILFHMGAVKKALGQVEEARDILLKAKAAGARNPKLAETNKLLAELKS